GVLKTGLGRSWRGQCRRRVDGQDRAWRYRLQRARGPALDGPVGRGISCPGQARRPSLQPRTPDSTGRPSGDLGSYLDLLSPFLEGGATNGSPSPVVVS